MVFGRKGLGGAVTKRKRFSSFRTLWGGITDRMRIRRKTTITEFRKEAERLLDSDDRGQE